VFQKTGKEFNVKRGKWIIFIILAAALSFLLVSCPDDSEPEDYSHLNQDNWNNNPSGDFRAPYNLRVDHRTGRIAELRWDEIYPRDFYVIGYEGVLKSTGATVYPRVEIRSAVNSQHLALEKDFLEMDVEYRIRVKRVWGNRESDWSNSITYSVSY